MELETTKITTKLLATNNKTNITSYITFLIPLYFLSPFASTSERFQRILSYIKNHYLFENFNNYTFHSYHVPENFSCT